MSIATMAAIIMGTFVVVGVAYLWGVASAEVRYEAQLRKIEKNETKHTSPALRSYYEVR